MDDDIPYLLLTPGPLTTTRSVRQAMLRDFSTWDVDYNQIVNSVRESVTRLVSSGSDFTSVLMQGSGTFGVESIIGSVVPPDGKIAIINNGAYGKRMVEISERLRIPTVELAFNETETPDLDLIRKALDSDNSISHVAVVHCETTTGMLNPIEAIGEIVASAGKSYIVDAMSSLGGIPIEMDTCKADYLISSANKCVQGVPGFSFVVCQKQRLLETQGWARSLSLDLFDQWQVMEQNGGKWRYTSPTHVVLAFAQALDELEAEGGVASRHKRYVENHRCLVDGMRRIGFQTLLPDELQSPIITAFYSPTSKQFEFAQFYDQLKQRRYVIYPGKVTLAETFRIGNIGNILPSDMESLVQHVAEVCSEMGIEL